MNILKNTIQSSVGFPAWEFNETPTEGLYSKFSFNLGFKCPLCNNMCRLDSPLTTLSRDVPESFHVLQSEIMAFIGPTRDFE